MVAEFRLKMKTFTALVTFKGFVQMSIHLFFSGCLVSQIVYYICRTSTVYGSVCSVCSVHVCCFFICCNLHTCKNIHCSFFIICHVLLSPGYLWQKKSVGMIQEWIEVHCCPFCLCCYFLFHYCLFSGHQVLCCLSCLVLLPFYH